MDRKGHPLGCCTVTLGTATSSLISPTEVFRPAIVVGATAIVVGHVHHSGNPSPSAADLQVTRRLREAAQIVDIQLTDHVICGVKAADPARRGYYSFREAGLL